MIFNYGYRDSTNARLTGVIEAPSRDEAYRLLKEKGVRPTFVALAPGLRNRLLSLGKRGWSIVILGFLTLGLLAIILLPFSPLHLHLLSPPTLSSSPLTRRQIYGDPALMEQLQLENYASLFAEEGDRVLAHFAQPAQIDRFVATLRRDPRARKNAAQALSALVGFNTETQRHGDSQSLISGRFRTSHPTNSVPLCLCVKDTRETSELTRIVRWMRGEFSAYLATGTGTPETYLARLLDRQQYEAQIYARAKRELEGVTDPAVYEKRNDELRAIGAPTIRLPLPEEE